MNEKERETIDAIDKQMARLFEERMAAVERIAANKKAAGAPVEDLAREKEMIRSRLGALGNRNIGSYYGEFLKSVIRVSKDYQTDIMGAPRSQHGDIIIRHGLLAATGEMTGLGAGKVLIVTDSGVPPAYSSTVAESLRRCGCTVSLHVFRQGEASKNIETYSQLLLTLVEEGFTRSDSIVAVGGGVVGDLAGFAAATFMRGIRFFNIPTTLLAQVDSSVGGKTAIDFGSVKNIVGAFHMPQKVLIDPDTLATLPRREFCNGLVEAIKMGATSDAALFELIENSCDIEADIEEIIRRSLAVKRAVVEADPTEKGLRRVLNFGHTAGHAIEACGAGEYLHGEAVAIGMLCFADGSAKERILALLRKLGLPTGHNIPAAVLRDFIAHDKKASGSEITVVRVHEIGSFNFEKIKIEDLAL